MKEFQFVSKNDYDEKLKFDDQKVYVYSKKKLNELYRYRQKPLIVGCAKEKGKDEIGTLRLGENIQLMVFDRRDISKVIYREIGYACVDDERYIAIIKSRIPFFLWFFVLLAAVIFAGFQLGGLLNKNPVIPVDESSTSPTILTPDFPLPATDPYLEEVSSNVNSNDHGNVNPNSDPSGDSDSNPNDKGGGTAGMSYTLGANVTLSTQKISMYFENPAESNQGMIVELLVLSKGEEYSIAKSGLVTSGTKLRTMNLQTNGVQLPEGIYTGIYRISFYNQMTGEKALVESDLTDVKITVKN